MSNIFGRWFGFGLGSAVGKALFDDGTDERGAPEAAKPVHTTETEFRADEKRYAEDEKRLDAESSAGKK